jgi:hypothetical protein
MKPAEHDEQELLNRLKMLAEAHKMFPTQYNLRSMLELVNELQCLYVRRLQHDWKKS